MQKICKYPLEFVPKQKHIIIQLPEDYRILSLQVQNNTPYIFAIVDPKKPLKDVILDRYYTDDDYDSSLQNNYTDTFIGTIQLENGFTSDCYYKDQYVTFHIFERIDLSNVPHIKPKVAICKT